MKRTNISHLQFEKFLFGSLGSLEAFVVDMLIFDSKATRGKFELRSCFWTVSDWKSAILLLCFRFEFTSYYNFHHKHFCIKCFCYFKLRKFQKYIYYQRRRQFNRFQDRVCCVQWLKYYYFHYSIKYSWRFKLHWPYDNCIQLRCFSWLYSINFNHSEQYNIWQECWFNA